MDPNNSVMKRLWCTCLAKMVLELIPDILSVFYMVEAESPGTKANNMLLFFRRNVYSDEK